ncbi:MAG: DUF2156 domain-containing protein [Oscillospiraceae bacterium]|nr:DUF2156 domain-containing protein [Oscillospiraceae bacterium]
MISYKSLEIKDKSWIDQIIKQANIMSSDYAFVNNFLWKDFLELDLVDNKNFFSVFSNRLNSYLFPLLKDPEIDSDNRIIKIINLLKQDAEKKNIRFKLFGLTIETKTLLNRLFHNKFEYILRKDMSDYIYNIKDLITLRGKKYHSKRNLVSQFKTKYYNWEYKSLNKDLLKSCLEVNKEWISHKKRDDDILSYESNLASLAFKYFDELDLFGGAILVNKKIIGFSISYEINNLVIDNVIEKSLVEYKGVYNILCQQFLNNIHDNYIYINREEDLGLENLRKAKLLLHPFLILDKYDALIL